MCAKHVMKTEVWRRMIKPIPWYKNIPNALLLSSIIFCTLYASDVKPLSSLSNISFKATHNSYQRKDSPTVQILEYNVWECELDFGVLPNSAELIVGHNGPEPK